MKLPEEKNLKISEIASIAGIKEDDARALAKTYDALIPSRKIGRVRLYPPQAAAILGEISKLSAHGFSSEEIATRVGKGSAGPRAARKISAGVKEEPAPKTADQRYSEPEPSRLSAVLPERELTGLRETGALLATRIQNLAKRVEALEKECLQLRDEFGGQMIQLRQATVNLQDQMDAADEWISYFELRLEGMLQQEEAAHELFRDWIAYFDKELDTLRKPWWRR